MIGLPAIATPSQSPYPPSPRARRGYCPVSKLHCRASARFLHDLVRVYRAPQVGNAFDARAGGSLGGNPCGRRRCANLVGFAPGQRAFPRPELEIAAARRDIDIARAADHGISIDGNFLIRGKPESGVAAKQARDDSLVESAHCGRMLRYHRGQRQGVRSRLRCPAQRPQYFVVTYRIFLLTTLRETPMIGAVSRTAS